MIVSLLITAALAWGAPPDPATHLGHAIGVDRVLLDWNKVVSYFQALAKDDPRVRVADIGRSVQGRPLIAAVISAEANMAKLNQYQQIQKQLADARKTPPEAAEKLIAQGKTVILITCSIHATEVASTHTAVEFAYRLLSEDKTKFKQILDNVIFILVPSLNPDGVDIVTQWYRKTLGTPFEGTSPPELYHAYVGHDNNRDWYIFSQPETRAVVSRLHNQWHPQIVYDVHQQGPNASRLFVPPWLDPIDPNVDPILMQMGNMIGMGMAADLTAAGKTGIAVNGIYDFWTPARHYQAYHGGIRILTESASARLATPLTVRPEQIDATGLGYNPRQSSWNHMEPWLGGEWRLRDIIDYQLIAWESLLWQSAVRREDMLRAFYTILRKASERQGPYAFVIPKKQLDPGSSRKLLETLAFGLVEVETTDAAFTADGKTYEPGSYVIRMRQPFSAFAKTLLERQQYPDLRTYPGGPPRQPYDVTAQTLPLLIGVTVDTIRDRFPATLNQTTTFKFDSAVAVTADALPAGDVDSWREVTKAWNTAKPVARDTAGNFYINKAAGGDRKPLRKPRIGLYRSWVPSMDEGWTRWILDNFGFAYTRLFNAEITAGNLRRKYDVIVFPDQGITQIHRGYSESAMPPEYTGGLGEKGGAALRQFATEGGTLVFLNDSTRYAMQHLGLKLKNSVAGVGAREFYSPGSLLNAHLDTRHPLTRGIPENVAIWSEGGPAWENAEGVNVIARYPENSVLASGWLLGEQYLTGRAALVEVPLGTGRILLYGMRPQYRAQSYQGFKLFFNALAGW